MSANTVRIRGEFDDKISGKLSKVRDDFDRLGKSKGFKSLAQGVGIGAGISAFNLLSDAVHGGVEAFFDAIQASSDLSETMSKSRVVFGGAATDIAAFGDTSAQSLGISKRAAVEAAATFGNFFTNIGETTTEAAKMSKTMVTLAGDLASFNNIGTDDALEKLRSGLAGEAEPLRELGVFLSEAKVKAKGMELGLLDAHGELDEGAKILARYNLILEETTKAQGDFERTSDGLANTQRQVNAEMQETGTSIGDIVLPGFLVLEHEFASIVRAAHNQVDAFRGVDRALLDLTATTDRNEDSTIRFRTAFAGASGVVDQFKARAEEAMRANDDLTASLVNDARSLLTDYYAPIKAQDELLANRSEATRLQRILDSKTATDAEKQDAKARLHAMQEDNLELKLTLAEAGALSRKDFDATLKTLRDHLGRAKGSARRDIQSVIDKFNELYQAGQQNFDISVRAHIGTGPTSGNVTQTFPKKKGQHGGYAHPGETWLVGEAGPETLVMGSQGGTIIPNGGGGGSVVVHTHINLDGKKIAEVVDEHQYYMSQRAAPTLLRA